MRRLDASPDGTIAPPAEQLAHSHRFASIASWHIATGRPPHATGASLLTLDLFRHLSYESVHHHHHHHLSHPFAPNGRPSTQPKTTRGLCPPQTTVIIGSRRRLLITESQLSASSLDPFLRRKPSSTRPRSPTSWSTRLPSIFARTFRPSRPH